MTSHSQASVIPFGNTQFRLDQLPPPWASVSLAKISELGSLEDNWDSYGARPVNPDCAASAVDFVLNVLDHSIASPTIVPTARGGIQFEWHRAGAELGIEIDSPGEFRVYFADERTSQESEMTCTDDLSSLKPLLARVSTSD